MSAARKHSRTVPAAGAFRVAASGPTASPWLKILTVCLRWTGILLLVLAAAALIAAGAPGLASTLLGGAIVVVFFAISLLIGHFIGRRNPSGALGVFLATYVIKVVGFAVVLFFVGRPVWLDGTWFFVAAVASVILWQGAEVFAFSRTRHQIYGDPDTGSAAVPPGAHQ